MDYLQLFFNYIKSTVRLIVAHLLDVDLIGGLNPLFLYVFLTLVGIVLTFLFGRVFRNR